MMDSAPAVLQLGRWFETKNGQTALAVIFGAATISCWHLSQLAPGRAATGFAVAGACALVLTVLYSGRASVMAVGEVVER